MAFSHIMAKAGIEQFHSDEDTDWDTVKQFNFALTLFCGLPRADTIFSTKCCYSKIATCMYSTT